MVNSTSNSPANSRVSNEQFMSRAEFERLVKFWQDRINNGNNQGRNVQNTSRTKESFAETEKPIGSRKAESLSKAKLTGSCFRNVHGGIFKKLKSLWTAFCDSLGVESAKNARANNVKDFSKMFDYLKTKYGEEYIPQSLKNKLDDIKKNGRSAMVTHGTLERAEKLIEKTIEE